MFRGRIIADHRIMGGVPCVKGTRIPAATVVGLVAERMSVDEILADYPQRVADDVQACLEYAAALLDERQIRLQAPA